MFKFGWQYGFINHNAMRRTLDALSKIAEFEDKILGWLTYLK